LSTVAAAATADVAALPAEIEAGSAGRAEGGGDVGGTDCGCASTASCFGSVIWPAGSGRGP